MTKSKAAKRKRRGSDGEVTAPGELARSEVTILPSAVVSDEASRSRKVQLPIGLLLASQHDLLQHVQHLLEDMCLQYGKRWCLAEMQKRQWMEPRSLELQCWVRFTRKHANLLPADAPSLQPPPTEPDLLTRVVSIRHLGVHRRNLDLSSILRLLDAAQKFATLHDDSPTSTSILQIMARVQEIYIDVIVQQECLKNRLQLKTLEIRAQQAELEHKARTETDILNRQILMEAEKKITDVLRTKPQDKSQQSPEADSPFHESSDIDDILMEAAAWMHVP